jgi:hypothetical protein
MRFPAKMLTCALLGLFAAGCGGGGGSKPPAETLSVSDSMVAFSATFGGASPASDSVNVTNTGSGALLYTAASDSPWLTVTPASGSVPQTLQISAALGTLIPSSYTGHITVTAAGAQGSPATITATFTVGQPAASDNPVWPQWGSNPQHTGMVAVAGQELAEILANIAYDPFVEQEKAENTVLFGSAVLTVHEQAPITDGNDVYMVMMSGTYNSCNPVGNWIYGDACGPNTWNTMDWNEVRYTWENGVLSPVWTFESDWYPEPNATNFNSGYAGLEGWEPVFHPAEANNFIYVPGAAGTVWKVDKNTGTSTSAINPFNGVAGVTPANTYVAGPLTADANGNIYYNVIQLNNSFGNPWDQNDVKNSWLVKITPDDTASTVTFATLVPGAPAGTSTNCPGTFFNLGDNGASLPWPPSATATASTQLCGSQRPGLNIAPAVGPDGTIYTASVAHFDSMAAYLIAVNPDLTPKWAASLQQRLTDGCGVILPIAGPGVTTLGNSCRNGTAVGVDPTTNANGSGSIIDEASSSPTVLPDGSVVFGVTDNYNFSRGHLMHFDASGNYINAYTFGWDSTPAVYSNNGTFSIVIKDNHYGGAAYCNFSNPVCDAVPDGPYYISQVDPANMTAEWSFQSTTVDANHPNGYEWCINMPAVDANGVVYVNSEDGNAYELPQGNTGVFKVATSKIFLNSAVGAAYTPLSLGIDGKIYTQNNGQLFVAGN